MAKSYSGHLSDPKASNLRRKKIADAHNGKGNWVRHPLEDNLVHSGQMVADLEGAVKISQPNES